MEGLFMRWREAWDERSVWLAISQTSVDIFIRRLIGIPQKPWLLLVLRGRLRGWMSRVLGQTNTKSVETHVLVSNETFSKFPQLTEVLTESESLNFFFDDSSIVNIALSPYFCKREGERHESFIFLDTRTGLTIGNSIIA